MSAWPRRSSPCWEGGCCVCRATRSRMAAAGDGTAEGIRIQWGAACPALGHGQPHRSTATPPCRWGASTHPAGGRHWYTVPATAPTRVHMQSRESRSPLRQDTTSQDMSEATATPSHLYISLSDNLHSMKCIYVVYLIQCCHYIAGGATSCCLFMFCNLWWICLF